MWYRILHSTFFNAGIIFGSLFVLMGFFIHRFPPKSTRSWYGYRSFLSTRNLDMWRAANEYAAYTSLRIGAVLILLGFACALLYDQQTDWFYYITVGAVVCGTMYIVGNTEWQLTRHFDKDGKRILPDVE
ncbi:putative membrane protein [Chitinophaga terrae (ex Kim and Jung 2007)]|uniref:SdpI family protein n=1 Tax=Chitinophaga terrae (ex Kim and Jung 2007) TaxID=408074 RepID=UPI002781706E|nr:SdpI family protein [Chitinophaga terrae (ex Kim and Jung 2007)]MDQ0108224.1 putative membrane protein [Chitinophaga terrae (ex Kim and Jung 2007)]